MAIGAVLGAAFHAFAPRLAPAIAKEGITSALSRKGASMVANRLTSYTATESGKRLVARGAGQRFATRLAEHEGTQRAARYAVRKDVNQRVQGEGQYGPKAQAKVVDVNAGSSTVPRSVSDPSVMNLVSNPNDPVVGLAKENERVAREQGGRNMKSRRGSGATGWGGTGKGWWEQNEQITQRAAFDPGSVTTLGKFDAARGPTRWAHSLGQGLGRSTVARGVGFVEGLRSVEAEEAGPDGRYGRKNPGGGTNVPGKAPAGGTAGTAGQTAPRVNFSTGPGDISDADVVEHHLTDVRQHGRGGAASIPSSTESSDTPFAGTYNGMGTQVGGSPQPRLSSFYGGSSGELGTGPAALNPAPTAPTTPQRPKPGMGDYGRNRFKSMMNEVGY